MTPGLGGWLLPGLAAALLPGLAAFILTRRNGPRGLAVALAICAAAALTGWLMTDRPLSGDATTTQALAIFLVIVPGLVSLVTGAVAGFWVALNRRG